MQSIADVVADKHTQGPEEEPIELQQDPTVEPLRDMQDDDDDLNNANIVEEDAVGENEDNSDMQQGGDDGELNVALQEGPTEDQMSTQGKTIKAK